MGLKFLRINSQFVLSEIFVLIEVSSKIDRSCLTNRTVMRSKFVGSEFVVRPWSACVILKNIYRNLIDSDARRLVVLS